ncbi:phage regulatory CII family protein [Trinickia soli]|uniref:Uncharacterized protein n=1 Tax=Trinickia soli TaxID=380675 RepID=A0A2N7VQ34_9BURK|nr:phage regulatory CII family protein [Trinickia soli]PMS19274.1 hypothetical protein C0Z19_21830 [Trinickia soli]CAB3644212.1 hypothetical protein LMG24076_00470 [Trinickia soli]
MNITDAAYAVAHDYPGGTESLAPRLGMSGAVLRNKVNPNNSTHHLTLKEAALLSAVANDRRIAIAFARELGLTCIEVPEPEHCADADVIELMARTWETNGEIGREVNKTFEDGIVEQHEVRRVKDRVWDHIRTLFGLVGRIEGMAEK